jgi:hypothetical protein
MPYESGAPLGLHAAGLRLWHSIANEYELDEHEQLLLVEACRIADRLDRLAAESDGAPLTTTNYKGDPCSNPLLVEARQQSLVFARLLASLRLPVGEEEDNRPQRRGAVRGVYSSNRRYGRAN